MEPLYGIFYLALSAMSTANWVPPPGWDGQTLLSAGASTLPAPPTAYFRELLSAEPSDRQRLIARQAPAVRSLLLAKIRQYEEMARDESDRQLRSLELRWYLRFLMHQQPTNRSSLLNQVPATHRALVESRLVYWDQFSPQVQDAILGYETAMRCQYSLPLGFQTLSNLPPVQRRRLQENIARWNALPAEQKQTIYWSFQAVFELNEPAPPPGLPANPAVATSVSQDPPMPAPLARMLNEFRKLPSSEQSDCLANFQRFTQLSQEERTRFIKAAATWSQLSPAERDSLRQAIRSGTGHLPPPAPPLPPGHPPLAASVE